MAGSKVPKAVQTRLRALFEADEKPRYAGNAMYVGDIMLKRGVRFTVAGAFWLGLGGAVPARFQGEIRDSKNLNGKCLRRWEEPLHCQEGRR